MIDAPDTLSTRFELNDSGFLVGKAVVTSTGVFPYKYADGHVEYELRLKDEVFANDTIASLKNRPVTLMHPTTLVQDSDSTEIGVGSTGEDISHDDTFLSVDMMVSRKDAIEAVMSGTLRALSLGYQCDLEDSAGVWCGVPYTKVQRNIRINHLAIVDRARQGDQARIRLDSSDAIMDSCSKDKEVIMPELGVINIDSVDYQAHDKVIEKFNTLKVSFDALEQEKATLVSEKTAIEADRDTLKDRLDSLTAEIAVLKNKGIDQAAVDAAVARKLRILDAARKADVEVKADMAEVDVQKAVIVKAFPKANLDGRDTVYVDARFDSAVDFIDMMNEQKNDAENRKVANDHAHEDSSTVVDSRTSRQNMIDSLTKAKKKKEA
jgi:hypothetical protein